MVQHLITYRLASFGKLSLLRPVARFVFRGAALFLLCVCIAGQITAQDDPFGDVAPAPAKPAAAKGDETKKPAAKPARGPSADDVQAAKERLKQQQAAEEERERMRSVLEAIAETNPTTPVELMRTVDTLLNLDQPDEAKKYLAKVIAMKLSPAALYDLQRRVGSGVFFKLTSDPRYHPEGLQLANAVLDASYAEARNPKRLADLVKQLNAPTPEERRAAVNDLKDAGEEAILPMLSAMADASRKSEHAGIRYGLSQMGELAIGPLLGTISTPNDHLRAQAIAVLGVMEVPRAVPYLIHPLLSKRHSPEVNRTAAEALRRIVGAVPNIRDAQTYLTDEVKAYGAGKLVSKADIDGNVEVWMWDPGQKLPARFKLPVEDAPLVIASQLANDLYDLWPNDDDVQQLYLVSILESEKMTGGLGRSLPSGEGSVRAAAGKLGAQKLERLLVEALRTDRIPAAIGAVEVLGDIGDESLLQSNDGRERPLAQALSHTDRRVRFFAAEAIVKIDPQHDFPGASHLPETLGYLAATAGAPRVLIGHPIASDAQSLVGMLLEIGFEADTALNGRDLFQRATNNPDYAVILLSDAIDKPAINELLQALRRDRRTGRIPIGLMVKADRLRARQLEVQNDELTEAFPRPHDTKALGFQISRLLSRAGRGNVGEAERLAQGAAALSWLAKFGESPEKYGHFDLLRQEEPIVLALIGGELTGRAAEPLGLLGTHHAQKTLLDVASNMTLPLADRQAAADAFKVAVERRGVLLLDEEVDEQYHRYNQSELLDAGTQHVLAQILDTIEEGIAKRSGLAEARE